MDAFSFGPRSICLIRSGISRAFFAIIFLAATGCSQPEPPTARSVSGPSIAELSQTIEQIRGLAVKQQVALSDQSTPTSSNGADEYSGQDIHQLSRAYKRIGLLSDSVDLEKSLIEFSRLRRIVSYDAERRAIILAPEAADLGQALAGATGNAGAVATVIGLSHALQEQHFQWQERVRRVTLEDRKLALRAVAEGDAIGVALTFLQANRPPATWADHVQAIGRLTAELTSAGSSLPVMLREKLIFPYREGSQFVQWAYTAKGWEGVNGLFADPPLSSSQILHPKKYYLRREAPIQITPFGWLRQVKQRAVVEQTLGEYLVQLLLASCYSRRDAAAIASGWTGDTLSAYPDGANLVTLWLSAWNNDGGAQDFYRALKTVLERSKDLRFTRSLDGWIADANGGRSVLLQAKGSVVLLLDGVESARVAEASEAIWRDLEVRAEPPAIPFETALTRRSRR